MNRRRDQLLQNLRAACRHEGEMLSLADQYQDDIETQKHCKAAADQAADRAEALHEKLLQDNMIVAEVEDVEKLFQEAIDILNDMEPSAEGFSEGLKTGIDMLFLVYDSMDEDETTNEEDSAATIR